MLSLNNAHIFDVLGTILYVTKITFGYNFAYRTEAKQS